MDAGLPIRLGAAAFDATGDERYLELGRERTIQVMAPHLTHVGVHDHGFNNVSTYGNLWRLIRRRSRRRRVGGAVLRAGPEDQRRRPGRPLGKNLDGSGYIYSFNGPQSLFVDTIRSCRALALAHQLGHSLYGERDERISLLQRLVEHALNTARYNIWYGEGRDAYDVAGRTAHETVFNTTTATTAAPRRSRAIRLSAPGPAAWPGRCSALPNSSNGSSPATTRSSKRRRPGGDRSDVSEGGSSHVRLLHRQHADRRRPLLGYRRPGPCRSGRLSRPPGRSVQRREPVDSSAAAIACQGLLRLGHYLVHKRGETKAGVRYVEAGLTTLHTLLDEPYLSTEPDTRA